MPFRLWPLEWNGLSPALCANRRALQQNRLLDRTMLVGIASQSVAMTVAIVGSFIIFPADL